MPGRDGCGGLLSRIQRYSTHDGPGIRTTVFLIGCNLRCAWCANPEAMLPGIKTLRFADRCRACGCCAGLSDPAERVEACPYEAYEASGWEATADGLCEILLRDRTYYDQSGGGVTFSGGEPMLQKTFVAECMSRLRAEGVHVALDTAGLWDYDACQDALALTDLVLLDMKLFEEKAHLRHTGVSNRTILENARRLAQAGMPLVVRLPLVPGITDDLGDITARLRLCHELGVRQVDILPYHRLGVGKYERLGLLYPLREVPECPREKAEAVRDKAEAMGLRATVGG